MLYDRYSSGLADVALVPAADQRDNIFCSFNLFGVAALMKKVVAFLQRYGVAVNGDGAGRRLFAVGR